MADVLRGVMGVDNQPFGILRISSPGSNVSGRLAIAESQFIVGAQVSDGTEAGYAAVRRLLLAHDGNFAYLDTGGKRPQDFDQALYISLRKMAEVWPDLPIDPNDLFDEEALLDKVFGGDGQPPADPSSGSLPIIQASQDDGQPRIKPPLIKALSDSGGSGKTAGAHKQAWKTIVQPLLSNSLVDGAKTVEGRPPFLDFDDTASHERQSLTKLRAGSADGEPWVKQLLKESFLSKQALVWIGLILILSLVATFVGMGALN
jgi:hypothetical protein